MQYWWERLEDDTFLGVLQPVTLGVVLVLAIHHLDRHVLLERLLEVVEALDVELNVCEKSSRSSVSVCRVVHGRGLATNRNRAPSAPIRNRR